MKWSIHAANVAAKDMKAALEKDQADFFKTSCKVVIQDKQTGNHPPLPRVTDEDHPDRAQVAKQSNAAIEMVCALAAKMGSPGSVFNVSLSGQEPQPENEIGDCVSVSINEVLAKAAKKTA